MTLWKLRFALEYCRKSRSIQKNQAKTMILNAYKSSKLHILIRRNFKQFVVCNNDNEKVIKPYWWEQYFDEPDSILYWR